MVEPCVKRLLSKRLQIGFQDQFLLNAGQKYCRMLQGEHSALLMTFIKLPFVIKIFVLSIFEWPFDTGLTVLPSAEILCEQFGPRLSPTKRCMKIAAFVIIAEVGRLCYLETFLVTFKKSFRNPIRVWIHIGTNFLGPNFLQMLIATGRERGIKIFRS